jgi:phosphotriesterase-related protein
MSYVQTVSDKIEPREMKKTLAHEHLLWDQRHYAPPLSGDLSERTFLQSKIDIKNAGRIRYNMHAHLDNLIQDNINEAIEELMEFKLAGGSTLCDCSCYGIGRDPNALLKISQATGINILMGTGAYIAKSHPEKIEKLSVHDMADLFIEEIVGGVNNTGIQAGFIGEIGISEQFPPREREVLEAACIAQRKTGTALLIHQPGFMELAGEILDIVEKHDGIIEKTVLCHMDASYNKPTYQDSLIKRGAFISFDQFGLEFLIVIPDYKDVWLPRDIDRIRAVAAHVKRGNAPKILLSQDISFKACYKKYGGYGYSHILENILPLLGHEGLDGGDLEKLIIENPSKLFSIE